MKTLRLLNAVTRQPTGNMLELASWEGRNYKVPPRQTTVNYQGRKVLGEIVDFQSPPENFNNYELSDGSQLKLKTVLLQVVRLIGEYGPNGDPVYTFGAQQIISVTAAENLKQKKQ